MLVTQSAGLNCAADGAAGVLVLEIAARLSV